jgi:hypothetical protein
MFLNINFFQNFLKSLVKYQGPDIYYGSGSVAPKIRITDPDAGQLIKYGSPDPDPEHCYVQYGTVPYLLSGSGPTEADLMNNTIN